MEKPGRRKISPKVREFAEALQQWATQGTEQERQQRETLLRWLLSRCESRGIQSHESQKSQGRNEYIIRRIDINEIDIKEAVVRAMAGYNPDLPTSGWVRGGPIWPRGYGEFWPKGYA